MNAELTLACAVAAGPDAMAAITAAWQGRKHGTCVALACTASGTPSSCRAVTSAINPGTNLLRCLCQIHRDARTPAPNKTTSHLEAKRHAGKQLLRSLPCPVRRHTVWRSRRPGQFGQLRPAQHGEITAVQERSMRADKHANIAWGTCCRMSASRACYKLPGDLLKP